MPVTILSRGQALSTVKFSGSAGLQTIFEDSNFGVRSIRVQGFIWEGAANCTIKDAQGSILFDRATSGPGIYSPDGSGSFGIICTSPLTMEVASSPAGGGGGLIVYGEVL